MTTANTDHRTWLLTRLREANAAYWLASERWTEHLLAAALNPTTDTIMLSSMMRAKMHAASCTLACATRDYLADIGE